MLEASNTNMQGRGGEVGSPLRGHSWTSLKEQVGVRRSCRRGFPGRRQTTHHALRQERHGEFGSL